LYLSSIKNKGEIPIQENIKKTDEMKRYEKETGKLAIWRGSITKGFEKWKKGEKIYEKDKERITILVPEETKNRWQNHIKESNISTISKLVRRSVDFYIEYGSKQNPMTTISKLSHDLKEPLTAIKGYTHLLIENYKDKLEWGILTKLKEVFDQCLILEEKINSTLDQNKNKVFQYDILIVDDDVTTNKVLIDFFKLKGYTCRDIITGTEALEELEKSIPKLLLLDIILPDINGYEICKKIKSNKKLKRIPIFYITAVPSYEVEKRIANTQADGYFLKPFNFEEFEILNNFL